MSLAMIVAIVYGNSQVWAEIDIWQKCVDLDKVVVAKIFIMSFSHIFLQPCRGKHPQHG